MHPRKLPEDVQYKERDVLARLLEWIHYLYSTHSRQVDFGEMIKSMVHEDPRKRPSASKVFHDTAKKVRDGRYFKIRCGKDCVSEAEHALDSELPMSAT